jgi:WhiB family transcriptional regulator, redox-sensing transcriptional regulator
MSGDGTNWRQQAACRTVDPDLFFSDRRIDRDAARRVCRDCPVKALCLDTAMKDEIGQPHARRSGVYGGATVSQRVKMAQGTSAPANARDRALPLLRTGMPAREVAEALSLHRATVERIAREFRDVLPDQTRAPGQPLPIVASDVDSITVEQVLSGVGSSTTRADRAVIVPRLAAQGMSDREIAHLCHTTDRTIFRARQLLGVKSRWSEFQNVGGAA